MDIPANPGTYVLVMESARRRELVVGSLGKGILNPGWYLYVGSALGPGGLKSRCGRHLRTNKTKRWHLDYLRPHVAVREIWYEQNAERLEHLWASALQRLGGLDCAWPKFGASDCDCETHLWHSDRRPSFKRFRLAGGGKPSRLLLEVKDA